MSRRTWAATGRWVAALAVAIAVVTAGCASTEDAGGGDDAGPADTSPIGQGGSINLIPASGEPQQGGKVTYGLDAESDGFDPAKNRFAPATNLVANAVYDPLAAIAADGTTQPYLAAAFEPAADFTRWTIRLRPNVSFHDDTPVNAEAVAAFLAGIKASALTAAAAAPVETITPVDDLTVEVAMNQPWSVFPSLLTAQAGFVTAPSMAADGESARHPVGSGPFVFDDWQVGSSVTVQRNPDYWRAGLPYLDTVEFRIVPDNQSRVSALVAGDLTMLHSSDTSTVAELTGLAEDGKIQLVYAEGEGEEGIVLLNTRAAPMDDLRVRQAMAYAIDKQRYLELNDAGADRDATGPFAPDSPWYADTGYPTYDLAKAQALVAEVEAEKGPIAFEFGGIPTPEIQRNGQVLAQFWTEAGMDVTFQTYDQPALIQKAVTGNFQAQFFRQFGGQDPDSDAVFWDGANAGGNGGLALNMTGNQDPELDAAIRLGRSTTDEAVRKQAYTTIQERFTADLPYLWLIHQVWAVGMDDSVRGLLDQTLPDGQPSAGMRNGVHRLTEVWLAA